MSKFLEILITTQKQPLVIHVFVIVYRQFSLKACFHYERGKKHSLFVLLLFFALASILTARFNRRSIKETKNALFHTRSGNGP